MSPKTTLFLCASVSILLASCGGGNGGGGSTGDPVGAACASDGDCASGHCNTEVCSQCGDNGDCGAGGTCVDDRAGGGYFVCQSAPTGAALGEVCHGPGDCMSGICNAETCSTCLGNGDCAGGEECRLGPNSYFECLEPPLAALGETCTEGAECDSGTCNGGVCSVCLENLDCPGAQECVEDTNAGYFVCMGGDTALGDACVEATECASGFCTGDVCSECGEAADCDGMEDCVDHTADTGYFLCEGTGGLGALGDACGNGTECASGFCNTDVCSECVRARDCVDGGGPATSTCEDDTTGVGYFVCDDGLLDLGDVCAEGTECSSGKCYNAILERFCSVCEVETDCLAGQECQFSGADGYASCVGTVALGDPCNLDEQCASTVCHMGVCSECRESADCTGGGTCADTAGHFACEGGLGDDCGSEADCNSGFCHGFLDTCSECTMDMDCGADRECNIDFGAGYAICEGTIPLSDACMDGPVCTSGFCNQEICSLCESNGDCPDGDCVDDTAGRGYFFCEAGLGDECSQDLDCASGACFTGGFLDVCSECGTNADCGPGRDCELDFLAGHAVCVGTVALGDPCNDPGQCTSGFCTDNACAECTVGDDCGAGGNCVDSAEAGYHICEGGFGEPCMGAGDCASGFCFNGPGPGNRVCSECLMSGDCPAGTCEYSADLGYAECI